MQNNKLIIVFLFFIFSFNSSFAIHNEIKVIVGREIITEQDVMNRVNMVALLSHVENSQILQEKKVMNDLITTLIREKLFAKQAKKNKIIVEKKAIQERLNEMLKKSNISEKDLERAIKNGLLNRETLENFIVNEISFREFVGKKIYPKLRSSKANKELLVEKINQKLQKSSGIYRIFQFSRKYDKSLIDSINSTVIKDCLQIEILEKKFGLKRVLVSNFKIGELNAGLKDVIIAKDNNKGIFSYKDGEDMNVIGFCQIELGKIEPLDQKKIDLLYKDHLLIEKINENYKFLHENNFILMKN